MTYSSPKRARICKERRQESMSDRIDQQLAKKMLAHLVAEFPLGVTLACCVDP